MHSNQQVNTNEREFLALILYTPYILWGVYFHKFCESGAICEFNNTQNYLPLKAPIPTHECDLCTQF